MGGVGAQRVNVGNIFRREDASARKGVNSSTPFRFCRGEPVGSLDHADGHGGNRLRNTVSGGQSGVEV